jgi:hypothetical protein
LRTFFASNHGFAENPAQNPQYWPGGLCLFIYIRKTGENEGFRVFILCTGRSRHARRTADRQTIFRIAHT